MDGEDQGGDNNEIMIDVKMEKGNIDGEEDEDVSRDEDGEG